MSIRTILIICGFLLPAMLFGQRPGGPSSAKKDTLTRVDVDHADLFEYFQESKKVIQKLIGNVELSQDSIYMYCDTAVIYDNIDVVANGKVVIQQGDSISVFSDSLIYDGTMRIADLYGEVVMVNGQQQLFTNRLTYDLKTKTATFFEGAMLVNGESQLTSKRGYYYVREKEAFFKDSVVVVDPNFTLRSDTLKFNTESRVVTFLGPTLISSDSSRVYCESGFYDMENELAEFTENAQYIKGKQEAVADVIRYNGQKEEYTLDGNASFVEEQRRATADVIKYNERSDVTHLIGNAEYRDSTRNIVAPEITYDRRREVYSTRGRSRISDPPQILEADQVDFKEEEGVGLAVGNVIWQDTSAQTTIVCEEAKYNRKTDYLKATGGRGGRPLLITLIDGDSLFMASDTLLSLRQDQLDKQIAAANNQKADTLTASVPDSLLSLPPDRFAQQPVVTDSLDAGALTASVTDSLLRSTVVQKDTTKQDSSRVLIAYNDVRIYKSDLQAICDSLIYSTLDSTFRLYIDPIIWSDTTQFIADTVNMLLKDNKIDRIFLYNNSFIINSPDEVFFNQIKGKNITAFFEENELRKMDVSGNAESVYYARDDAGGYVGVNKTICSDMLLYFGNNQVDKIKFFAEPKATLNPMRQVNHESLKMKGFQWEVKRRPGQLEDLFIPRQRSPKPAQLPGLVPATLPEATATEPEREEINTDQ